MHTAQRHAILAIIAMIEHGLTQLKGLLLTPGNDAQGSGAPRRDPPEATGYLSPDEDEQLEREMEEARAEALKAREISMAKMLEIDDEFFPGGEG